MMIGMGMPRSSSMSERMETSEDGVVERGGQASRCRPPKVAARLATKAPLSKDTKIHRAA